MIARSGLPPYKGWNHRNVPLLEGAEMDGCDGRNVVNACNPVVFLGAERSESLGLSYVLWVLYQL